MGVTLSGLKFSGCCHRGTLTQTRCASLGGLGYSTVSRPPRGQTGPRPPPWRTLLTAWPKALGKPRGQTGPRPPPWRTLLTAWPKALGKQRHSYQAGHSKDLVAISPEQRGQTCLGNVQGWDNQSLSCGHQPPRGWTVGPGRGFPRAAPLESL